ncbi:MAG: ComEA family DNA-binding protein, partial [Tepidisphaerales bacterium]
YRLQLDARAGTERVLELNAVTADSVFAEDTDTSDDSASIPGDQEHIGRFIPTPADLAVLAEGIAASAGSTTVTDTLRNELSDAWAGYDLLLVDGPARGQSRTIVASTPAGGTLTLARAWDMIPPAGSRYLIRANNYAWAGRLFDYIDVLAPRGANLPNAETEGYAYWDAAAKAWSPVTPAPVSVAHHAGPPHAALAIEGLVNVNTAPWKVLAAVSFFSPESDELDFRLGDLDPATRGVAAGDSNGLWDNDELARAIVAWREAHGPFRSLFDLYRVPAFASASRICAHNSGGALPDFEQRVYLLGQAGNLLATRSDSFTCYIYLQGWRGLGTMTPSLVVERRRGAIIDRSGARSVPLELSSHGFCND